MANNTKSKEKAEQSTSGIFRSFSELYALGKGLREKCPRSSHAEWKAPQTRPDPLFLLTESSKGRIPELLPLRYGRMLQSPFERA